MSSKRRLRRKSCEGKSVYSDIKAANTAVYHLLRKNKISGYIPSARLKSYKCNYCTGWHIGNTDHLYLNRRFNDKKRRVKT